MVEIYVSSQENEKKLRTRENELKNGDNSLECLKMTIESANHEILEALSDLHTTL
jgi:hypothetical protein